VSTPVPPSGPLNLEQQRKRAKDLLRAARTGDPEALARLATARRRVPDEVPRLTLAEAQYAVAREAGHPSWPKLVASVQAHDVAAFREAVRAANVPRVRQLLTSSHVRAVVNQPMFDFGQRAAHVAAGHEAMLAVLIEGGADLNLKSDWQNGPYTVLDNATEATATFLLAHGATLTPNVAARLGWLDRLQALLDDDATLVHERGGDGQQPLHQARTIEIADLLLARGADIDARCIDHSSTPAQYALGDRPDVCRHLLARGATPDIFMAARLGDVDLATRLIAADPACLDARVNEPGYALVPPFNIYCWSLGFGLSPHDVARTFGQHAVAAVLDASSPRRVRLLSALLAVDEASVDAILKEDPSLLSTMTASDHGRLAQAIFHGHVEAASLMLRVGFDPAAPGIDGGSALHAACWIGNLAIVEQVLARGRVPLDLPDPVHKSPPLGWASFGSVHRRAAGADYPGVIDRLVAAGADVRAVGNVRGMSLLEMAAGSADTQDALRRHGAR
jgi:ankyrin repeat protein